MQHVSTAFCRTDPSKSRLKESLSAISYYSIGAKPRLHYLDSNADASAACAATALPQRRHHKFSTSQLHFTTSQTGFNEIGTKFVSHQAKAVIASQVSNVSEVGSHQRSNRAPTLRIGAATRCITPLPLACGSQCNAPPANLPLPAPTAGARRLCDSGFEPGASVCKLLQTQNTRKLIRPLFDRQHAQRHASARGTRGQVGCGRHLLCNSFLVVANQSVCRCCSKAWQSVPHWASQNGRMLVVQAGAFKHTAPPAARPGRR